MQIVRLTNEHRAQYEKFVAASLSGSFLQSWSWGEFQTTQGKAVVRYGVFDDSQNSMTPQLVTTVQFLDTKVPYLPGHYLYAPYGPLIANEFNSVTTKEVVQNLIEQVKKDFNGRAWFVRIESKNDVSLSGVPSVHIQPGSTLITNLNSTEDELLANMHNKTRYNIKVAAKHGVSVEVNEVANEQALQLLEQTSSRQNYKSYSSAYYKKLIDFFAEQNSDASVKLYIAKYGNKIIASAIMIDHGSTRTYLFGGSNDNQRNVMAPYAMHWQAIRDAKQLGLTRYDWWGTETATGKSAGFVQFKLRWGGEQIQYQPAFDIVFNKAWYSIYKVLRKINRFF